MRASEIMPTSPNRRAYVLTALGLFVVYAVTLAPGITTGDSGDLATAAIELGVAHPTGYPLFTMLAHLASLVPLPGEPIVRIECLNALFGVAAAMLVALTVRRLALSLLAPLPEWAADYGGLLAGALLALAPVLWDQVRIPEVYALHAVLVCWALFELVRFEQLRSPASLYRVAIPLALGGAHHVTIVYMLVATALYVGIRKPSAMISWVVAPLWPVVRRGRGRERPAWLDSWWVVPAGLLTGALGLSFYAYFWWAAEHTAALPWGGTTNLERIVRHASGRQYRRYMAGAENPGLLRRLVALPQWFDRQLMIGTVFPVALGLGVLVRRAWPLALSFVVYALLNIGHGLQYKVSDYANYYLPAVCVLGLFAGLGFALCGKWLVAARAKSERGPGLVFAGLCATLSLIYAYYWIFASERLSPALRESAWGWLGLVALVLTTGAVVAHALLGRSSRRATLHLRLCLVAIVAAYLPTWAVRLHARADPNYKSQVAYAEEVTRDVPPGAIYLTGGDSYAFPLWYYQHVLGVGREALLVNIHMLRSSWYLDYLRKRNPRGCDLYGDMDPGAYATACGQYQARLDRNESSWFKLGAKKRRGNTSRPRSEPHNYVIIDGGQLECQDPEYRADNKNACLCWDTNDTWRAWDEECVWVAELGGVVRRSQREIDAHRLIANHIDERPVYERNVATRWLGASKNPREWDGPAYNRMSARYALVNRGRINQVVYRRDIEDQDVCGSRELVRAKQPTLSPPRAMSLPISKRPRYEPNEVPLLIRWSVLQDAARDHGHEPRRGFAMHESIWLSLWWFERWYYAHEADKHRGAPVRHGVRVCVFDPDGHRTHTQALVTRGQLSQVELPSEARTRPGTYTVQACTVGELGGELGEDAQEVPESRPCERTILEYEFVLGPAATRAAIELSGWRPS